MPVPAYLRDPDAIYEASFRTIREEGAAALARLEADAHDLAIRIAHACGMVDAIEDLEISPDAVAVGRAALASGAPILVDAQMVAHGIVGARLPRNNAVVCRLNEPDIPERARALATTRSAAQVDLWDADLAGAVVAIGNAPTALFRLLERLDEGAPKPAVILGFPVGFVGAAESKVELAANPRAVPFATLHGRRGGSAVAAAAVNALAAGLQGAPA
ncbi:precorrin-8X methylmutase [Aureimonas sp. ME7]|uniref:precorrin-8X methylmutase n=1 Tax=Aureimonas sp. ME7 TaxID=2744252 RepID=UPI0015F75AFA|nr:precorrin-8X methylmutase [Aureimonas sp. ME7]